MVRRDSTSISFYWRNCLFILFVDSFVCIRVFEKRMREENVEWRSLHNEKPNSLYRSPNIVRVIKSRRLR